MIESKQIPNLIQGVSQQSPQQRRDSQCEEQFDCLNSPSEGAVARPGFDLMSVHDYDLRDHFLFDISRALDEHYLVAINGVTSTTFNLAEGGTEVGLGVVSSSLSAISGGRSAGYAKQTVGDTTFIAARNLIPDLYTGGALGPLPARPKEALVFFKAGAYLNTYALAVIFSGTVYRYTYTTPDNSTAGNAAYISTAQLAATFYRAMTGSAAPGNSYGTGATHAGDPGGSGGGIPTTVTGTPSVLTAVGFSVEINGNLIRIWRNDGQDFDIDVADGQGGSAMVALKDDIQSFSNLPRGGFEGMTFRVRPKGEDAEAADYYVEFVKKTAAQGYWQERVAPGATRALIPDVMPQRITVNAKNSLTVRPGQWSTRVAGDGVNSALDPKFVGKPIRALFWHKGRLGILTASTVDFSKARYPFTFFPDTAQTVLPSDPISFEVAGPQSTAPLFAVSQVGEALMLWSQGSQFLVTSGNDPFRQDTAEADPSTSYEFAERCPFVSLGLGMYFVTESGGFASVRNLQFQGGKPLGDVDVTDHVPAYIPAGCDQMSVTDTGKLLAVQTEGDPLKLYIYNFLVRDREIVQSAWSKWRMPPDQAGASGGRIMWSGIKGMDVYVALHRGGKLFLLKAPLSLKANDEGLEMRLRLDLRFNEAAATSISYNAGTGLTSVGLPYPVLSGDLPRFRIIRRSAGGDGPGEEFSVDSVSVDGMTAYVEGDITSVEWFAGFSISSERWESEFFLRGPQGVVPTDELTISGFRINHAGTGYYRIEVEQGGDRTRTEELPVRGMFDEPDPLSARNIQTGSLFIPVEAEAATTRIKIINDSVFPSRWISAEYQYQAVMRARPSRVRTQE